MPYILRYMNFTIILLQQKQAFPKLLPQSWKGSTIQNILVHTGAMESESYREKHPHYCRLIKNSQASFKHACIEWSARSWSKIHHSVGRFFTNPQFNMNELYAIATDILLWIKRYDFLRQLFKTIFLSSQQIVLLIR